MANTIGQLLFMDSSILLMTMTLADLVVVVVVVIVVVGQTVGSISSRTLAYDCLCTLEL